MLPSLAECLPTLLPEDRHRSNCCNTVLPFLHETVDRGQKQINLSVVYYCHKLSEVNKTTVLLKVSKSWFYVIFSYCSKCRSVKSFQKTSSTKVSDQNRRKNNCSGHHITIQCCQHKVGLESYMFN